MHSLKKNNSEKSKPKTYSYLCVIEHFKTANQLFLYHLILIIIYKGAFIIYGLGEGGELEGGGGAYFFGGAIFLTHHFVIFFRKSDITCIITVVGTQQQHKGIFLNMGQGGGQNFPTLSWGGAIFFPHIREGGRLFFCLSILTNHHPPPPPRP